MNYREDSEPPIRQGMVLRAWEADRMTFREIFDYDSLQAICEQTRLCMEQERKGAAKRVAIKKATASEVAFATITAAARNLSSDTAHPRNLSRISFVTSPNAISSSSQMTSIRNYRQSQHPSRPETTASALNQQLPEITMDILNLRIFHLKRELVKIDKDRFALPGQLIPSSRRMDYKENHRPVSTRGTQLWEPIFLHRERILKVELEIIRSRNMQIGIELAEKLGVARVRRKFLPLKRLGIAPAPLMSGNGWSVVPYQRGGHDPHHVEFTLQRREENRKILADMDLEAQRRNILLEKLEMQMKNCKGKGQARLAQRVSFRRE